MEYKECNSGMMRSEANESIYGRHPVHEALLAERRRFKKIFLAEGAQRRGILDVIIGLAEMRKIPITTVSRSILDEISDHHQGVVAEVTCYPYVEMEDILVKAKRSSEPSFILLLDVLQNPQNLGTLFRTAEAVGIQGIILPQRRGAGVTAAVVSASAGASEHLWVAQENLVKAIRTLKENGLWIVGLDISPEALHLEQIDLKRPIGLIVGGEQKGIRRLVRDSCDYLAKIPMRGRIDSLNASVAGSIALYMIWQARGFPGQRIIAGKVDWEE
jgi:23S rRNA (guanosine2251-2'-O)-methyltransferase